MAGLGALAQLVTRGAGCPLLRMSEARRSSGRLPQQFDEPWSDPRDHACRDQHQRARDVWVQEPVDLLAWFHADLGQQRLGHRDGACLLDGVGPVEDVDRGITTITLEIS